MPTNYHSPKLLTLKQQKQLLQNCTSNKYRVIILLMLDCGLRVTETIRLQLKHFNFQQNHLIVESLKKRGKKHQRQIPLTQRLLDAISDYWQTLKSTTPESYLFPPSSQSQQKHLSRKQVWRKIKKLSNGAVYPHMLRHTFATRIVNNGNELRIAKELLGHRSIATTEIYTHVSADQVKSAIQSIEKESWWTKQLRRLFPRKPIHVSPIPGDQLAFHIGRKEELNKLLEYGQKKINLLILGPQGIGKTHLLEQYNLGNIIKIGDFGSTKTLLTGMLLHLFKGDKENSSKTIFQKELTKKGIETIVYRQTIKRLT
ncbi:MAG: tyrosine-type recombinase/integrase, partial [Bacteroidota bacterium]